MSHHFVTACILCLLCAAHTTCGSHIEKNQESNFIQFKPDIAGESQNLDFRQKSDRYNEKLHKIRNHNVVTDVERKKREVRNVNPAGYVEEIFRLYGDPGSMTMDLSGFNKMLDALDLHKLIEGGEQKAETKDYIYGQNKEEAVNCVSSQELISTVNTRLKPHGHSHHHENHDGDHDSDDTLTQRTLESICPILLYQKLANTSLERNGCVKDNMPSKLVEYKPNEIAYVKNSAAVWLYSTISIFAISACGLLGVAVIPIMHKSYYNHLLQFLVALAVGTLCGDALLHLMPHAMSPLEDDQGVPQFDHDDGMWKGLAAMTGVVFFYFMEKGLTVIAEFRKRRQKLEDNKLPQRVRVLKDDSTEHCSKDLKSIQSSSSNTFLKFFKKDDKSDPKTKTCKHKYSEYPYCYDEIETDTHNDHHHRDGQAPGSNKKGNSVSIVSSHDLNAKEEPSAKDWLLNSETPAVVEMNNINHKDDGAKDLKDGDSYTVILREHSRAHHGHSHSHGHVHAPPSSMSSVAWMVIMGDGLHNFTDGMAIGAAFASNIAGGFSTAIAVLCHELPHELGDFAVLIKAGMSVRRACWYNLVSSLLCLGGMVLGVLAGHAPSATRWLFATAAGTFLYIALVDMMPELSTSHSKEGTLCQCILQLMGLATGVGIMLIIAMYEHDLKNLFG